MNMHRKEVIEWLRQNNTSWDDAQSKRIPRRFSNWTWFGNELVNQAGDKILEGDVFAGPMPPIPEVVKPVTREWLVSYLSNIKWPSVYDQQHPELPSEAVKDGWAWVVRDQVYIVAKNGCVQICKEDIQPTTKRVSSREWMLLIASNLEWPSINDKLILALPPECVKSGWQWGQLPDSEGGDFILVNPREIMIKKEDAKNFSGGFMLSATGDFTISKKESGLKFYDDSRKTAPDFLEAGARHMRDRAAQRDSATGERSMKATVDAFNALYGTQLTETQGWQFMVLLKMSRARTGVFNPDDYEDQAAYAALAGESAQ